MEEIRILVPRYNGANKKKSEQYHRKLSLARKIECYLKERYCKHNEGSLIIMYHEIASAINEPPQQVEDVASLLQAGGNGITLYKE